MIDTPNNNNKLNLSSHPFMNPFPPPTPPTFPNDEFQGPTSLLKICFDQHVERINLLNEKGEFYLKYSVDFISDLEPFFFFSPFFVCFCFGIFEHRNTGTAQLVVLDRKTRHNNEVCSIPQCGERLS